MRRADVQLLAFGFLLTFFSSFGQTFFVGLFATELREAAQLGDGAFGSLYSAATLTSAFCVFWAGGLIDRVALPLYMTVTALLLAAGCVLVTFAEHIVWLALALFLLRFAGQGLLTHTAVTTIARFFARMRGKALAAAMLGHPTGQAVLPIAAVTIAAATGWQTVWMLAAAAAVAAIPLLWWLCAPARRLAAERIAQNGNANAATGASEPNDATRREVLRDRRFHLLLPTILLPGFTGTGVFIHQARLIGEKGWELPWFAVCFMVFAAFQVGSTLGSGPLIDRLTARRLVPFCLLPLGLGCLLINLTDHRLIALPFMAGAGLTAGATAAIATALWAELYGTTHLGSIRALGGSAVIASTALAPATFGWLLEAGVSFGAILIVNAAIAAVATLMARAAVAATGARHRA